MIYARNKQVKGHENYDIVLQIQWETCIKNTIDICRVCNEFDFDEMIYYWINMRETPETEVVSYIKWIFTWNILFKLKVL